MPLTVIVRALASAAPCAPASSTSAPATPSSAARDDIRLTFDGTQRVIIGRGPGSDVRLPDASVSHRHASLRAQGGEFAVLDEGSTNGTFVGSVRVAPHTSRLVRSGDLVRVGRIWLELRIDQGPATRDVAAATRDLALALVAQAMEAIGTDRHPRVRIVEGPDQGAVLRLTDADRVYVVGRAAHCDLAVADVDSSREHLHVVTRGGAVFVRDPGAKNGTWVGEARVIGDREVPWRPLDMIRIGRTVLSLEEPVREALAAIEQVTDEPLASQETFETPPLPLPPSSLSSLPPSSASSALAGAPAEAAGSAGAAAPVEAVAMTPAQVALRNRSRWSMTDRLVLGAAALVLVLSLAGLVWLLKG